MAVTNKKYLGVLSKLPLQKTLYIGDDVAGFSPNIQGIALLQKPPEHIYH